MKLCRVQEMQALDKRAVKEYGIVEEILMENAGLAAFRVLLDEFGVKNRRFLILCGIGNNGGDGLVIARKIHSMGGIVRILLLGDPGKYSGAAGRNYAIAASLGLDIQPLDSIGTLEDALLCSDMVIDAIFGTGLMRDVEGIYAAAVEKINHSSLSVLSLDIPSGIKGDTGEVLGAAVKADATVTFGLPKLGNLLYPGFEHCGKLFVTHISFPPELTDDPSLQFSVNQPQLIPERNPNAHKGNFGDALFISGAASYLGAPLYSSLSYLKAGGGYARLAAPASITPFIATQGGELVFAPMKETSAGTLSKNNLRELMDISELSDFVVLGPGLSLHEETQELCLTLISDLKKPLLIDGDGLSALSQDTSLLRKRSQPTILTPHLGEMARLTGLEMEEILREKPFLVQKYASQWEAVIILKGAHSLIGLPDGRVLVNLSGNSGMATAGSGDVLTGCIAAMCGLGLSLEDAAGTGVFLHGFAGDLAAAELGEDGMTARDIQNSLPEAIRLFRQNSEVILANHYESIYLI